jgi:hypothetical protein
MLLLDTVVWINNIRNAIEAIQTTLTSSSDEALANKYASIGGLLSSLCTVLSGFMVHHDQVFGPFVLLI